MSKKALVTGCAGFIGSHLSEALIQSGWEVIGIDCLTNNYESKIKEANISSFLSSPDFKFIREDLMEVQLEEYLEGVDYIFHLAAQPGVRGSWGKQFDIYIRNNVLATQRLLEAAKNCRIKKLVYASSSSVYGSTNVFPMHEFHLPRPFSPYGLTKIAAENLCHLYCRNFGVPVVSLRYFTVYGPRQRPDMAISIFIKSIYAGLPITLYGDGRQMRDFTYVDDIVRANILAAQSAVEGEMFNVGSGQPIELLKVVRMLEGKIGKEVQLNFVPDQKGDVRDTYADISKIKHILGFEPEINLEEGLANQVEYMS